MGLLGGGLFVSFAFSRGRELAELRRLYVVSPISACDLPPRPPTVYISAFGYYFRILWS